MSLPLSGLSKRKWYIAGALAVASLVSILIITLAATLFKVPEVIAAPSVSSTANLVLGQTDFTTSNLLSAAGISSPSGLVIDTPHHRLFISDTGNNRVLGWNISTPIVSGRMADIVLGQANFRNNLAPAPTSSSMNAPTALALDSSGNLYVADSGNNRVLVFAYNSTFSSYTGKAAGYVLGQGGSFITKGSGATADNFSNPNGVAVDSSGHLFIADSSNNRVLEYDTPLVASPAADRVIGQSDLTSNSANQSATPGINTLSNPRGLAVNGSGVLAVADSDNNRILLYTSPLSATYNLSANNVFGQGGYFTSNSATNPPTNKSLNSPNSVAFDANTPQNLYVADKLNHRVLKFNSPFAGDSQASLVFGQQGSFTTKTSGTANDSIWGPQDVKVDASGNLFVIDTVNNRMLEYTSPSTVPPAADFVLGQTTFTSGGANALADSAMLKTPGGVVYDKVRNRLYVADTANHRVLGWNSSSLANNNAPADIVIGQPNFWSVAMPDPPTASSLSLPKGLAVDVDGNLYVADSGNNRVVLYLNPFATDTIADRVFGQPDLTTYNDNWTPSQTTLRNPGWVAVDSSVNPNRLYISDTKNQRVLAYPTPKVSSVPSLVIGKTSFIDAPIQYSDPSTSSNTFETSGIVVDGKGNLYVNDYYRHRTLFFPTPFDSGGTTATKVLGQPDMVSATDYPLNAYADTMYYQRGIAIDPNGNLFIADSGNARVLYWSYKGSVIPATNGQAADGVLGQSDLTSKSAGLSNSKFGLTDKLTNAMEGLATDAYGRLYVVDRSNNRVLRFSTNPPSDVKFTSHPTTVPADVYSTAIHVQLVDANGNRMVSDTDSIVNLTSSSGTGSFFTLANGSYSSIASGAATIPAGTVGIDVYYKDSTANASAYTLTAKLGSSTGDTFLMTVNETPKTLVYKNTDDGAKGTFSYAIANANSGDTITFRLEANQPITFVSGSTLPVINKELKIGELTDCINGPSIVIDGTNLTSHALSTQYRLQIIGVKFKKMKLVTNTFVNSGGTFENIFKCTSFDNSSSS